MKKLAILLFSALLSFSTTVMADAPAYDVTPPQEWHLKPHLNQHGNYAFRQYNHRHPYQWTNSSEGLELGTVSGPALVQNAINKGIISQIAVQASIGYVQISPKFQGLSFRDQRLLAYAMDDYYRAKKGLNYRLYVLQTKDGKDWGSFTKYGLHIY